MGRCTRPGYPPEGYTAAYTLPNGQNFADDFHVFAVGVGAAADSAVR